MRIFFKNFIIQAIIYAIPLALNAQNLDAYNLLLFNLEQTGNQFKISKPQCLTGFNPSGYNNQPYFFAPNEIWLTSQHANDTNQTEIIALNFEANTLRAVTQTSLSEYSPTLMPDGTSWSAIVVEADGEQRLWHFPAQGGGKGKVLLPNIKGVGYHAWLNETDLALFIVGTPHTLVKTSVNTQRQIKIASNIGRALQVHPNGKLYYVAKTTEQTWFIKSYQPSTEKQEIICKTLQDAEDFVLLSDGTIMMGSNSKLYIWQAETWKMVADLAEFGVKKITRLAAKYGKIAIVVQ
jgi:hypothetical protein